MTFDGSIRGAPIAIVRRMKTLKVLLLIACVLLLESDRAAPAPLTRLALHVR